MTLALAELFAVSGSVSVALTLAVLLSVPATLELITKVTWTEALALITPSAQPKVPALLLHKP